jgi:hypothetical protein
MRRGALLVALVLHAWTPAAGTGRSTAQAFQSPPDDSRVMMRWWWFGPSVTHEQLDAEMRAMKDGGLGGFEVATVYPMAVDDPARGIRNYPYLSPEFLDAIRFTARRSRELGLRMDVTLGSGWSFGGPHITPDLAAARLRSHRREIAPGVMQIARPVPYEHERLIAGFVGRGAMRGEVDPNSFRELDISGNGPIPIPPGAGPRTLVFYFASHTGQVVKRAALGAEGYVLDHYNRAAIEKHLREVGDPLVAAAGPGAIHAIFCDSLEVYEADWTGDMPAEFEKRRGYALRPLLPLLEYNGDGAASLRRDLGRTQTELYEERFLVPIQEWSRKNGVRFRIQGYGAPPAALSSHRYADLLDGEGFEWRTPSRARWAASAAHLLGRPLVASETWTWIHSPAFRATPLDLKAEADLHFLSGVNQLIGHGWPYSPPQAGAPGWPFYAAGVFTNRNPWWPVMKDLASYLQRVSFVLRQGEPVADIAVYAPTEDARADMRPGTGGYLNLWMAIRDRIGPAAVPAILDAGYNFDLIDDGTLKEAAVRNYKAIVLPGVRWMPDATKQWLAEYARGGGKLLALGRVPEGHWPSLEPITEEELGRHLQRVVPPDVQFTTAAAAAPRDDGIGVVHRRLPDADIYFLANTANETRHVGARFRARTEHGELWDPFTGAIERLPAENAGNDLLLVSFEPYESRIVVFRRAPGAWPASQTRSVRISEELRSGWSVSLGTAAPAAVDLPHSWADSGSTRYFSGTATYRRGFDLPPGRRAPGTRIVLDFGQAKPIQREPLPDGTMRGNSFAALVAAPIREAATVFVNGRRAGSVWAPPYRVDITDHVRDGQNELRIEVYNTAINQLAEGGLPDVKALVEKYGQRFRLQDMEGLAPLPSGMLTVPRLLTEH